MPRIPGVALLVVWVISLPAASPTAAGDEPLHVRIDKLVAARADGPLAARSSDAEFLRRVYLDLAGRIPPPDAARAFLADTGKDKRSKLVDRLLQQELYARRMADLFHVMLMERRGDHEEWGRFLRASFAANKPWDRMVREMLDPDSEQPETRGAAYFITRRLEKYGQNPTDMPGLVRDVGRLFLGVDVQCAQCHDHLFVDDYKQWHYQGLFAFVGNTFIRRDVTFPAIGEKPLTKKVEFTSVFDMEPQATGPRLPGGAEVPIPELKRDELYVTPPDSKKKTPGVLKFSPLKLLAQQLPTADNKAFSRNIVNRLWWVMMGHGLVFPLDLQHSDNPPSHPELLELLAHEFVAHGYDIQWLLRELALSDTYQRSGLLPGQDDDAPAEQYRVALEKPLSAEQLLFSLLQATGPAGEARRTEAADGDGDVKQIAATEPDQQADPATLTLDQLRERFKKALANPPKEPEVQVNPTVKGALFLSNDEVVLAWLRPQPGNLVDRLSKLSQPRAVAEELYLSALTRTPSDEEVAEVDAYLQRHADQRETALGHLAWALLASTEFFVNH